MSSTLRVVVYGYGFLVQREIPIPPETPTDVLELVTDAILETRTPHIEAFAVWIRDVDRVFGYRTLCRVDLWVRSRESQESLRIRFEARPLQSKRRRVKRAFGSDRLRGLESATALDHALTKLGFVDQAQQRSLKF